MLLASRKTVLHLLMLLMAAFVVVPVSEAFACLVEPDAVAGQVQADAVDAGSPHDAAADGACGHGHCHHSSLSLPAELSPSHGEPAPAVWVATPGTAAHAVALGGPTRPPRS
ncbi:hypothetical protein [Stenotrophomonas mori]|uniref:DUF2946 domain-containing protein n=1 Tax=Stenotrophomonas mori TaxID=2871096 RepID=A0ABT0SGS0_9GAMM|nr:hypothetical protein [Stenotrophomonas mori]MCL7714519.1 hypothetical protein [Stenotrophomonas mori]